MHISLLHTKKETVEAWMLYSGNAMSECHGKLQIIGKPKIHIVMNQKQGILFDEDVACIEKTLHENTFS